jgi:hypothetical protein
MSGLHYTLDRSVIAPRPQTSGRRFPQRRARSIRTWVVELEESHARAITGTKESSLLTYEDVPEQARFTDVTLDIDESQPDLGILICARLSDDADGGLVVEKYRFAISEIRDRMRGLAMQS